MFYHLKHIWTTYPWLMVLAAVIVGCKSSAPVVIQPRTDSVIVKYELRHDSVYIDRAHDVYIKGDTIFIHDTLTQKFYSVSNKIDTIYRDKEVAVDHPPEKYIPPFYKTCTVILFICIILLLIYLALRVAKAVYLRK